jgi:DNA-binding winged helix-turn-helix (wHTH) protein
MSAAVATFDGTSWNWFATISPPRRFCKRQDAHSVTGDNPPVPRYRFSEFVVSPRRRLLLRGDRELPLIPRYFDLLVFLIERRHEAVHRRDIFDKVWTDVIVSDSALSQAIRTIRRTLGDDSREPRFIRTVSRHGYRFVYDDVIEEADDTTPGGPAVVTPAAVAPAAPPGYGAVTASPDAFEPLLARLTVPAATADEEEDRRDAAERLHALGTGEALTRLGTRPGHTRARALLRDARWAVPQAGHVPLLGAPSPLAVAAELITLRVRGAVRIIATRWAGASIGGGLAGACAGAVGGGLLALVPDGTAPFAVAPVLAVIGAVCGAAGGAAVGAGLSLAEAVVRSRRPFALMCGAAAGGAAIGGLIQWIATRALATIVGVNVAIGGAIEGLAIGAAAGAGYALATTRATGGLAAPLGRRRLYAAAITALCVGLAALALALSGRPLVGGTVHAIARAAQGSQVALTPLARLIGEPDFGPWTRAIIGAGEGALFGFGLALGLTRRPRPARP